MRARRIDSSVISCSALILILMTVLLAPTGCAGGPEPTSNDTSAPAPAVEQPRQNDVIETESQERELGPERQGQAAPLPSLGAIEAIVLAELPPKRTPVLFENAPIVRIESGSVFVLSTAGENETDYAELSRISRAYDPNAEAVPLFVEKFALADGSLALAQTVGLGTAQAIGPFQVFSLREDGSGPFCAALAVYTQTGTESRWSIFPNDEEPVRFNLENSGRITTEVRDITSNGILDVVETRREPEAGFGFETYLTLYQWNGEDLVETDVMPVVRTLNRFLERANGFIENERWNDLVQFVLHPTARQQLSEAGRSAADMVRAVFRVQEAENAPENPYGFLEDGGAVANVFAPQILENPFQQARRFRHDLRIVAEDGANYIVSALVELSPNPFREPVFTFAVWE